MINGLGKFREHFAGLENRYVLIGGVACALLFKRSGLEFRSTKDVDMVLCVEVVDEAFSTAFRKFLNGGGYQAREHASGRRELYRFHKPTNREYPHMLEVFSRRPGTLAFDMDTAFARIPVANEQVSLSAILLEDNYYDAIANARREISGISLVDETLLIPFKAKAYLDLSQRAERGEPVDNKNILKHRNDVLRLTQLLIISAPVDVSDTLRDDVSDFLRHIARGNLPEGKSLGLPFSTQRAMELLHAVFLSGKQ